MWPQNIHLIHGLGLLLFVLLSPVLSMGQDVTQHAITIGSSEFEINGRTNVSSFQCSLKEDYTEKTLLVESVLWSNTQLSFGGMEFSYPVTNFECALRPMTKELHETLNASEYPELLLEVRDITVTDGNSEIQNLQVGAHVTITLAGVKKDILISDGFVINESGDSLVLGGSKELLLSDFNLEPPTKMLGLVRVMDQLLVSFRIAMKAQSIR